MLDSICQTDSCVPIGAMEFRHLRYFVAVAEELSFTRAAAVLHVAQSAVSAQIRFLEDSVGVTLLERNSRRVELTGAGRTFLQGAKKLLFDLEEIARQTRKRLSTRTNRGVM